MLQGDRSIWPQNNWKKANYFLEMQHYLQFDCCQIGIYLRKTMVIKTINENYAEVDRS